MSDNIIYFPSPSTFNDPFDCSVLLRPDLATRDQVVQYYYQHYKEKQPLQKDSILRQLAKEDYRQKRHKNSDIVKQFNKEVIELNKTTGIFSLTPSYNSLLMWSHYAGSHKGFCIGFNAYRLLSFTSEYLHKKKGLSIALFKVLYSSGYPIINPFALEQTDKLPNITTKSDIWSYEQEYRLILLNKANHEVELPKDVIRRVILGCQISLRDRDEIVAILKKGNDTVHLYQAKQLEDKYGLGFEYINYK